MKHTAGILVIGWVMIVACRVEKHTARTSQDKTSSILWKISGKDLSSPSYLFGTIHLICPDKFFWTAAMQHAFESCDQVAEEVDMNDTSSIRTMQRGMFLPEGKKLQDYFTPEVYKEIVTFATDSLGIMGAAMVLPHLKPNVALVIFKEGHSV